MLPGDPSSQTLLKAGLTWSFDVKIKSVHRVSVFDCLFVVLSLFIPILSFRARTIHSLLTQISRYITHSVLKQSHFELETLLALHSRIVTTFAEGKKA
jgi:hypothetical protein